MSLKLFQTSLTQLIATSIPVIGIILCNIGLYYREKNDKLEQEKNDILWGETSMKIHKSGGILNQDNKNEQVAETGFVDCARQEILNAFMRLENLLENNVLFTDIEKGRVNEYYGLLKCHTIDSFRREQEQYGKIDECYNSKFLSRFKNVNILLKK